jgi:hypothetical protein
VKAKKSFLQRRDASETIEKSCEARMDAPDKSGADHDENDNVLDASFLSWG